MPIVLPESMDKPIEEPRDTELTPQEIVAELDKYIVGQKDAKKAVAIALRNRFRRRKLPDELGRDRPQEYHHDRPDRRGQDRDRPPTGQAHRLAVPQDRGLQVHRGGLRRPGRGIHGPGPDRMAVDMVKAEKVAEIAEKAKGAVEERLLDLLLPQPGVREDAADEEAARSGETREKLRNSSGRASWKTAWWSSKSRRRRRLRSRSSPPPGWRRWTCSSRISCWGSWAGDPSRGR